ncbi:MAG: response regulator [Ignavibacteria bacterium]|jgi:CheY-like chemotaxis protein|nr:response regulator [Ignavibacteria bacterium]
MINGKSVTVGLVDDDKVFQFITAKILKSLNVIDCILQFENGLPLLEYLQNNFDKPESLPDVIFLDIQMPFMDGWQFLQEYSNLRISFAKQIKIYILSSSISLYDKEKAKAYNQIKDFLVKPIGREKYTEILEESCK